MKKLSKNELTALRLLQESGGSIIEWMVPDKTEKNLAFGDVVPGHGIYRKLEKMGLAFYTEEEPFNRPSDPMDGFTFSREIYISDAERYENFEQAKLIYNHLTETYQNYGYKLIEVPKDTMNNRILFILDEISR